jgi:uncharacterized protein (DUF952 family)
LNIVHITSRKAWIEATRAGRYIAPSLESEGLIHCSTYSQALPVAEKYYKGQSGLVLLVIDPKQLTSDLKWEPPAEGAPPPGVRAGEAFPHIYGPINLDAVIQALDFEPDPNDRFTLPPALFPENQP